MNLWLEIFIYSKVFLKNLSRNNSLSPLRSLAKFNFSNFLFSLFIKNIIENE